MVLLLHFLAGLAARNRALRAASTLPPAPAQLDGALAALKIDRQRCRDFAQTHSWAACTEQFLSLQWPAPRAPATAPAVAALPAAR